METGAGEITVGRGNDVGVASGRVAGNGVGAGEGEAGAQANNRRIIKAISADRKSSLVAAFFSGIQATGSKAGVPVRFIGRRGKVKSCLEKSAQKVPFIRR